MKVATLNDITFDEYDVGLLTADLDNLLKARALQYSIMPKLNVLLQETINRIRNIYGIEVFDNYSTISKWPAFRETRENDLKANYQSAFVGLGGIRKKVWNGIKKANGEDATIVPFTLGFEMIPDGLHVVFSLSRYPVNLKKESYAKYLEFLKKYSGNLFNIFNLFKISFIHQAEPCLDITVEQLLDMIINADDKELYKIWFDYKVKNTAPEELNLAVDVASVLYAFYHSLIEISIGNEPNIKKMLHNFNDYFTERLEQIFTQTEKQDSLKIKVHINGIAKKVDSIDVKAGIRWQVFERDDFKCVCCGATALDGAILHVDHILPRSKGGKDELSNFQTLCHLCNIGKSNKSDVNLRERR